MLSSTCCKQSLRSDHILFVTARKAWGSLRLHLTLQHIGVTGCWRHRAHSKAFTTSVLPPSLSSCRMVQGVKPQTLNSLSSASPDIGRFGSSQKQCRARIWLMEDREAHDICKVMGNSIQVHSPDVAALHLHQVGEKKLSQLRVLPQKGNVPVDHTHFSESNEPLGCPTHLTAHACHVPQYPCSLCDPAAQVPGTG